MISQREFRISPMAKKHSELWNVLIFDSNCPSTSGSQYIDRIGEVRGNSSQK